MCTVYNNERNNVERRIENVIGEWEEEGKEIIIGGDFNIRIGELGGMKTEEMEVGRRIKDKVINNGGRNLAEWIMERWKEIGKENSRM